MSEDIVNVWDGVQNTSCWVHDDSSWETDGVVERSAVDIVALAGQAQQDADRAAASADSAAASAESAAGAIAGMLSGDNTFTGTNTFTSQIIGDISGTAGSSLGFADYSAGIDYAIGATVKGSDGNLYVALAASGPSSTAVDPVGDATQTWKNLCLGEALNVKDFGAVGDGVTDDTAALNAAMTAAAGERLYFPSGTYLTSESVKIPSNTEIFGDGWASSVIKLTADSFAEPCVTNAANIVGEEASNTGNENIYIHDLCVDGNGYRANGSGSSGSSGSAISLKNVHHVVVRNVKAMHGRLHCLDIASAQYTDLYDPANGKDWTLGASSFVRVENFIGYDAAADDVITTHYSHDIQLINCHATSWDSSKEGSTRPFALTFNQCGIEIDDGSYNVEVRGCYASGFCRGIVAKAHNNGTAAEAALPSREVAFYDCFSEGNNINYEVGYNGTLLPVGSIGFYNCVSEQPKEIVTADDSNNLRYFYFYGRAKTLVLDGMACRGETGSTANFGIYINPLASAFPNGNNSCVIRNVTFDGVSVASGTGSGGSLIRLTANIGTNVYEISNIIAQDCNDVPVIYNTSDSMHRVDTIYAISSSALTSYVIQMNDDTVTKSGSIKNIKHQNYAGAIKYGNQVVASLNNTETEIGNGQIEVLNYRSTESSLFKRFRMHRGGSNLPNGGGAGIAFGRKDALADRDDCWIHEVVTSFSAGLAKMSFGIRKANDSNPPTDVWAIYASGHLAPESDNTYNFGAANQAVANLYSHDGTVKSSDARLKTDMATVPDAVLDAWADVQWAEFRFLSSIEKKGDEARKHTGLIAQRVNDAFTAHGLDASRYGLFCHDTWDAEPEVTDEEGNVLQEARPAGDKYSLRYDECLCMEAAYQRRRAARAEARLAALERKMEEMEQVLAVSKSKVYEPIATGSTAARDLRDRFGDVVNVKDFGAKGDGVTDDAAAFTAAASATGNVVRDNDWFVNGVLQ